MITRLLRWWRYFQIGFSNYISRPVSFLNFILIFRIYMTDYIPLLVELFPRLSQFAIFAFIVLTGGSVLFGWLHYKKTGAQKTQQILEYQTNPIAVRNMTVWMESLEQIMRDHGITPTHKFLEHKGLMDSWDKK